MQMHGKKRLLVAGIMGGIAIVAVVIFIHALQFSAIEQTVVMYLAEKQQIETEHAAHQIETHLTMMRDELLTKSKFPVIEEVSALRCINATGTHPDTVSDTLLQLDRNGDVIGCSSSQYSAFAGASLKNSPLFQKPRETREPYVSGAMNEGSSAFIAVSVPLFETSGYTPYPDFRKSFQGTIIGIVSVTSIYHSFIHPITDADGSSFILMHEGDGQVLLQSDGIGQDLINPIVRASPLSEEKKYALAKLPVMGKAIITSESIILGGETWKLAVITPLSYHNKDIREAQAGHIASLIIIVLLMAGVFVLLLSLYRSKETAEEKLSQVHVTLEELGINISHETDKPYAKPAFSLVSGKVYLIADDSENQAYELFAGLLQEGNAGFALTRENPSSVQERYHLKNTPFLWLSKAKSEQYPSETDPKKLLALIREFIEKGGKSAVLIDRLEYLIAEHGEQETLGMVRNLKDAITGKQAVLILGINPESITQQALASLRTEAVDLYHKELARSLHLTGQELAILSLINERNAEHKMISFRDISASQNITKPTTRARIRRLYDLGLVTVDQKGRYKSLSLTAKGRRALGG
ncbi:TPA: DUF835 domain-containing protein [Candidatus Woesearchaeota archaeon]|nr:DUF835 domain-containing protein [Candidatus Woesearchaeota archaeon]